MTIRSRSLVSANLVCRKQLPRCASVSLSSCQSELFHGDISAKQSNIKGRNKNTVCGWQLFKSTRMYVLSTVIVLFSVALFSVTPPPVQGHGRLIAPPSRASAWRYGFSTPPDYNDHELYCGGFARQWNRNNGKCGVCGDAWDTPTPRAHELGGTYGQGVIVRQYRPRTWIIIRVELTANHNGHFEFRLCPNYKNTTQECLDKYVLRLARMKSDEGMDPLGYRYYPRDGNKIYEIKYRLPDISCSHCVLQWIYIAGNNWGTCPNGTGAVGCGPQEEFRACADIAIGSSSTDPDTTLTPDLTTTPADVEPPVPEDTYHQRITTIVITVVALVLVLVLLAVLYSYYYQVGRTVKEWLKGGKRSKEQPQVPVPPPRVRKTRAPPPPPYDGRMYNVSLDRESMA